MFQIFGRRPLSKHLLEDALRAFVERSDEYTAEDRAIALNLADDFRISPDREAHFLARVSQPPSSGTLRDDLTDYFKSEIRWGDPPVFLDGSNKDNFVPMATGKPGEPGLHPQLELARLLDLTGLHLVFERNTGHPSGEFAELQDKKGDLDYFRTWLEGKCTSAAAAKEHFVESTLRMLNEDRRLRKEWRYHPTWATLWTDFEEFGPHGATRWCQVMGVRPRADRAWVIALRYKVYEASGLCRPTQLDSDWGGCYHFPTSSGVPVEDGGLAMDRGGQAQQLVHEYIHPQTDHRLRHWTDGGSLMGQADWADPVGLPVQRQRHHDLLVRLGQSARRWRF